MTEVELAWLAGLLEGEGCFYLATRKNQDGTPRPLLSVICSMTDEDVIRRMHDLIGFGNFHTRDRSHENPRYKKSYTWQSSDALLLMPLLHSLLPLMGERRGAKIDELIAAMDGWKRIMTRDHGKLWMYQKGCRCAFCKKANATRRKEYLDADSSRREKARLKNHEYYQAHRSELIESNMRYRARKKAQNISPD